MSKRLKSFLISLLVGALLCAMVIFINRDQGYGLLRQLCDGCFVAAVLLLGAGVLRYVTNQGAFDVLGYGLQSVFHLHVPGASIGNARDQETMETYRERKAKKRKSPAGMLFAGLVWLALSAMKFHPVLKKLTAAALSAVLLILFEASA